MNKNSIQSYFDENNQQKFNSQKAKIVRYLKGNPNRSRFSTGEHLGISSHAAQKRLSDLSKEGTIKATSERKHGENTVSLYSLNEQFQLFDVPKKQTFIQWIKTEYPHIMAEWKARNNYITTF